MDCTSKKKKKNQQSTLLFSLWVSCDWSGEDTFEQVVSLLSLLFWWWFSPTCWITLVYKKFLLVFLKKSCNLEAKKEIVQKKTVTAGNNRARFHWAPIYRGANKTMPCPVGVNQNPQQPNLSQVRTFNAWTSQPWSSFFNKLQSETLLNRHFWTFNSRVIVWCWDCLSFWSRAIKRTKKEKRQSLLKRPKIINLK